MKKYKYTWKQFDVDCKNLVRRIKYAKYEPKTIVALARGGLPLGVKLSHLMGRYMMIVSAKTYNSKNQQDNTVLLNSSYTVPLQSPTLIVDEIVDNGKTLKIVKRHFQALGIQVKTATLLYKEHSVVKPDWYMKKVPNDCWVEFPWEV